jgi:hypothetical protein
MIQSLLESHILIAERLSSIEIGIGSSSEALPPPAERTYNVPETIHRNAQGFAFEEELEHSWVYKRSSERGASGAFSVISSAGRTASWSMLSGLSLYDNISTIAVQALPIYEYDIDNSDMYQFGAFNEGQAISNIHTIDVPEPRPPRKTGSTTSTQQNLRTWWQGVVIRRKSSPLQSEERQGLLPRLQSTSSHTEAVRAVFRIPISVSITYAHVAISMQDEKGNPYIYGHIPIAVAKVGVYLKEKGIAQVKIIENALTIS